MQHHISLAFRYGKHMPFQSHLISGRTTVEERIVRSVIRHRGKGSLFTARPPRVERRLHPPNRFLPPALPKADTLDS